MHTNLIWYYWYQNCVSLFQCMLENTCFCFISLCNMQILCDEKITLSDILYDVYCYSHVLAAEPDYNNEMTVNPTIWNENDELTLIQSRIGSKV